MHGDCLDVLRTLEADNNNLCIFKDLSVKTCYNFLTIIEPHGMLAHPWGSEQSPCEQGATVMPKIYSNTSSISDLAAGVAGEHLVCVDLLLQGYRAFLADQNCPYDVAVEMDHKLIRIQAKTTRFPRQIPQRKNHSLAYMWHIRRAGKGGRRVYQHDEFDLLALVALDVRLVAYLPPTHFLQTMHIRAQELDQYPVSLALSQLDLFSVSSYIKKA